MEQTEFIIYKEMMDMVDKDTKKTIDRLIYLRKQLDNVIDNTITEYALRDKPVDVNDLKGHLDYQIEDNLNLLKVFR